MICSNCGKEIPDGAIFCPFCGSKCVKKMCATCGAELKEGQLFCHACGTKVCGEVSKDKAGAMKVLNIICIILSVISLLFSLLLTVETIRAIEKMYHRFSTILFFSYSGKLVFVECIELIYIIYIRYKFAHKGKDVTITDAIINIVLTTAFLIVLILVWGYLSRFNQF